MIVPVLRELVVQWAWGGDGSKCCAILCKAIAIVRISCRKRGSRPLEMALRKWVDGPGVTCGWSLPSAGVKVFCKGAMVNEVGRGSQWWVCTWYDWEHTIYSLIFVIFYPYLRMCFYWEGYGGRDRERGTWMWEKHQSFSYLGIEPGPFWYGTMLQSIDPPGQGKPPFRSD